MFKLGLCAGACLIAGLVVSSAGPAASSSGAWFRVTEHRLASDGSTTNQPMRIVEVRRDGTRRVVARASTWVAVSPDGKYRAWGVERDGRTSIMVAPIAAGRARAVRVAGCLLSGGAQCLGVSWSPTNLLAFVAYDGGDKPTYTVGVARANGALLRRFVYPVRTGPDRTVTRFVGSWSPDGRRVLISAMESTGGFETGSTLSLLDTKTWTLKRVFRWGVAQGHAVYGVVA